MIADLKFAVRQLRTAPGFTVTAVLTLALGIGANTAIFTLIDSIMLRPLPFPQQERLVRINYGGGQSDAENSFFPKGWLRALGQSSQTLSSVSGFGPNAEANVGDASSSTRVFGAEVMANAFDTLGIHPAVGRLFTPEDGIAGHDPVVVLSYGYWRQQYASSPAVIGQTIRIDGVSRRIAGVMPAGVHFPYAETQFVTPVTFKGGDVFGPWFAFDLRGFGRLKPGVTPQQAQSELHRLHRFLLPQFPFRMPDIWASEMTVVPLLESQVGAMRPRLLLLFAAVGLILLIACANVANLMLARAAGRTREIAIRGALGASATRLVRQLLSESIVLGLLSGAVGLATAALAMKALVTLLPADTPRLADVGLHWPVFVFAAATSLLTGFLFGLIPALQMASRDLRDALQSGSRGVAGRTGQFRTSMFLVVGQIGLSVVVLTFAGLMLHSLWSLSQVDPGFRPDRVVTAEVALDANACQTKGHCSAFFQTLLQRLQGAGGVQSVALADSLPLVAQQGNYVYDAENHPRAPREGARVATSRTVSPGYFSALRLTLVRGRLLDEQDTSGASRAVVINQRMADLLWPNQDPIGKHLLNVGDEPSPAVWAPDHALTVVGLVNNTHEGGLTGNFGEELYLPLTPARERPVLYVLLRSQATTQGSAEALRNTVFNLDPSVPITRIRSMNEVVASTQASSRAITILLLSFGALALAIGGVGVYSLIAYIVSWRTREIGIRIALGAQRWQIVKSIVTQSLLLALGGSAAGLITASLLGRLLRGSLFEVKAVDPITYGAVPIVMIAIALVASWVPAMRAAAIDPIKTLRME
ncbi:ABC transporter permease [Acidobacteria bacterium AB60]|nr:ABC transporter permease [Acidobacteria bacterium AB60]